MYCPECGNDAGDANFCPDCGADLKGVRGALGGETGGQSVRTTGQRRKGGGGGPPARPADAAKPAPTAAAPSKLSPAIIWGGFGVIAVIVVIIVVLAAGGLSGNKGNASTGTSSTSSSTPVAADTSGSYQQLLDRGNALYNQGGKAMPNGVPTDQSSQYFAAAATVYQAAWAKQAGDPNLGTDWATSLFYAGNVDAALKQINVVLKSNPAFQKGLFNKGIFLSHKSRFLKGAQAKQYLQLAKVAFTAAVAADPKSDVGKQADSALQTLNQ